MIIFVLPSSLTIVCLLFVPVANLRSQDDFGTGVGKPPYTVSRETTFFTEPVRKNGWVDFAAAINARLSAGVTPENNACVLIYEAFGPTPDNVKMPAAFFDELKMRPPQDEGEYLRPRPNFGDDQKARNDAFHADLGKAMSKPWKRTEFSDVSNWLDENEKPLKKMTAASRRERYFSPFITIRDHNPEPIPMAEVLLPGAQLSRTVSRMFIARVMRHLGDDQTEAAWEDLLTCHRLARHFGSGATAIEGLVGIASETVAIDAEITFIRVTRPTSAQARRYRLELNEMPPVTRMSDKWDALERCLALELLSSLATDWKEAINAYEHESGIKALDLIVKQVGANSFDWDAAFIRLNHWFDRTVAALELPNFSDRKAAVEQLRAELDSHKSVLMQPETIDDEIANDSKKISPKFGDWMASITFSTVSQLRTAESRVKQRYKNLELALALAAFHADKGQYPERLIELRPKYYAGQLVDFYSGQALIYRRQEAGYLLYSVGENLIDDNAQTFGETPAGDDLRVKVEN